MKSAEEIILRGSGRYLPARKVSNDDLAQIVDTSDEWIFTRTGIKTRYIASPEEPTSFLAIQAAQRAIEAAGLAKESIDLVIVATSTPDSVFPAMAALVQNALGLRPVPAFDLQMACSGFIYALEVASQMLKGGAYTHALVIGVDTMSSLVNWKDRSTCVLFADGAGAVVLSREAKGLAPPEEPLKASSTHRPVYGLSVLENKIWNDGSLASILKVVPGNAVVPGSASEGLPWLTPHIHMQGRELFKWAVKTVGKTLEELLAKYAPAQIDWIIPHQANMRIVETLADYLKLPLDRFICNLECYGNTSAASIPIALDEALRSGKISPGQKVLLVGFGAGLSWGTSLLESK